MDHRVKPGDDDLDWYDGREPFAWLPSFGPLNPCASPPTAAHLTRAATMTAKTKCKETPWRPRGSTVVPMQAPDLAVEEIERRASDNRFVSVLVLAQGESLLGRRHYWPVYQAAEKYKLPIAVHAGSQYRGAPSSIGWPSFRYEYYLAEAQAFQAQLLSLIYEGVFLKFPGLKVVLMESGVSWLPAFMWRANKTWRGVRVEVPWIDREPAAIMRDHIRLTTQPFDAPPDAAGVADIIDMIGSGKTFLFASEYPHWQFDGDDAVPPHLPAGIRSRMCADNSLANLSRLSLPP